MYSLGLLHSFKNRLDATSLFLGIRAFPTGYSMKFLPFAVVLKMFFTACAE